MAMRLISIDAADDGRVRQMRNADIFEPAGRDTRLTIELSGAQAGDAAVVKNIMAHTLNWDRERIAANLNVTSGAELPAARANRGLRSPPTPPAQRRSTRPKKMPIN